MAVPEERRLAVPALLAGCVQNPVPVVDLPLGKRWFFFVSDRLGWISSPGIDSVTAFFFSFFLY